MAEVSGMVVTDLDGTLLDSRGQLGERNRDTLESLPALGVVRVVATGRNLFSARQALPADMPIDYLVFASGAGTVRWRDGELLRRCDLDAAQALEAAAQLVELGLDFMLHRGVPDNHRFWYHRSRHGNHDFERRLARYQDHCEPWPAGGAVQAPVGPFSQLLAVEAPETALTHDDLRTLLAPLNVIRATSPLDHRSFWYEIFPPDVSKAAGADVLREHYRVDHDQVLAVGNDYNDEALLDWAARSRVVANAPADLRARYDAVASNDDAGFTEAVSAWLAARGAS